ncbi:GNAT family N-acetyltransferase [Amorphus orientalis]|uniref:N-acyltransferase n=1 Tax=Amorphus orientalis TaxID=649198 RepID=A0AAE3VS20_9HYPH|nr:GNAT family N-acetyltransferase [Amorphus orientalis]MDQ0317123.1 putative N-acyltransferase [Amorphus orientalis]
MSADPSAPSDLVLKAAGGVSSVDRDVWNALANPGWTRKGGALVQDGTPPHAYDPFVDHDFLSALEETGCVGPEAGWYPRPLLIEDADGVIRAAAPSYLKTHSRGEYVFDYGWADAFERAGGTYYPKLQVSVPFTPVTGPRLLVGRGEDAETLKAHLGEGLAAFAAQADASSVHATFLFEEDWTDLLDRGYLARTDVQFHWIDRNYGDFDGFLAALSSRKRKQIRRERRDALAAGLEIEWVTGADLTEAHWDDFFAFYMDTGARKWGQPYLNRAFFSALGEKMADRVALVFARHEGHAIAGALNLIGSETLYGRYWGCLEDHPFLHFEICYYQAIDFALAHGLTRVEAGAQGEHKLARGYEPHITRSAHFILHPGLRRAIADYLERERQAISAEREFLLEHAPYKRGGDDR